MSGSLGDIIVRFTGDASQLAATISDVQGQLSGLEGAQSRAAAGSRAGAAAANSYASRLQAAGKGIKEFGKNLDTVTKPLQVTSLAFAAGGVASAKFAIDFENDFAKVKKTVEGTPEQLKEVKQGIIDLTTTGINGKNAIPQTTKQLTELAAAGGQLGIETPNIVDFTEVMAQMGTATNLAGAEGAATLARFMNVTDTSQDKIRNVGSAIVDLGNNFATTESEIATLGLRMGATGNVVGISAQDILGYSTALSSMGIEAEAGGSAVSRIWMDIQSAVSTGGEGLATFAKVSGKSSAEFANQWKNDASGAFQTFLVGLSKSEDQVKTLEELGFNNIRDIQALQRLASSKGIGLLEQALHRANTAWSENIALQKEADAMAETTAGQIQITKNNLVEAGRSIGESFLPMIAKGSTSVRNFAQGIADMSDEGKENLVGVATGIVALGTGAKVVSSSAKWLGGFAEALGKIRAASPALKSFGVAGVIAAGTITALTAAYLGMEAVRKKVINSRNYTLGLDEEARKAETAAEAYKNLSDLSKEVDELQVKIMAADTSKEEIDAAKSRLQEIKKILTDEYNLTIEVDDHELDEALEELTEYQALKARDSANSFKDSIISGKDQYQDDINDKNGTGANYSRLTEKRSNILNAKNDLHDYREEWQELNEDLGKGSISQENYNKSLGELKQNIADVFNNGDVAERYRGMLPNVDDLEAVSNQIDFLSNEYSGLEEAASAAEAAEKNRQERIKKYTENAQDMAKNAATLLATDVQNGNWKDAQRDLEDMSIAVKAAGLDVDEYAQKAAIAQNGVSGLSEVWQKGGDTLSNFVNDYIKNSQKFGASAAQTAAGAALIQNGFKDFKSAAAEGKLDIINEQANQLAHSMGLLPENKTIKISAEGDISLIDNATQNIEEINGENVTVGVQVNGKDEIVTVTELVKNFGMETAVAILTAQDDASIIVDGVSYKIQGIDKTTGKARVEAEDGATLVLDLVTGKLYNLDGTEAHPKVVFDKDSSEPDNYQPEDKPADVVFGVNDSAVKSYVPPNKTATVTYSINTVVKGGLPTPHALANGITAKGTSDAKAGFGIINDERGIPDPTELLIRDGVGYTFKGRDVPIMFKEHDVLLNATQTKGVLKNLPHYASGKNNEAWESAKADREHIRKTSYRIIPAWEELEWLDEMKRKFASDAEVIKEIEEEVVTYTKNMWSENLETQQYALDMGWISQEEYYSHLAAYRDENFAPDTEEYRDATLKLHKYSVQLIDDANDVSKAWINLRNTFNDWDEIGESPLAAYQRINERNLQAVSEGNKTYQEYLDLMNDTTKDLIGGRTDYSFNWIDHAQKYEALDADGTIAGLHRVQTYVDEFFGGLGAMTEEQYAVKLDLDATLADKKMDAWKDKMSEWEDDADWHQKQAEVYGWEAMGDSETDFYQRKINEYTKWSNDPNLSENDRKYALRQADEMRLELYKATEDSYDEMLSEFKDRMDEAEELLDEKLSALDEKWEVEDRAENKAETLSDIEKYKNAVTIEGREKYQEALDKLKEIEREEQRYAIELENNAIMEQMQADYEALEAEKQRILEQTREANMKIASLVEPLKTLETGMNNKVDELIRVLREEIANIKPDVTVNQTNYQYIADKTDAIIFSNKSTSDILSNVGG